jgi:basic membrane lipoprotein Med (substrate-binding protein (PBP1-ABC) superfamily)
MIVIVVIIVAAIVGTVGYYFFVSSAPTKRTIKVAMLMIGGIKDMAWHAQHYQALQKIKTTLGVDVAYSEYLSGPDVEKAGRDYIESGYNVIIYTTGAFRNAMEVLSKEYPDVLHILVEGYTTDLKDNVAVIIDQSQEIGYVEGILAAHLTKNKKVGFVASDIVPDILLLASGFKYGVEKIDPEIQIIPAVVGSFIDPQKGKEVALGVIDMGADVLVAVGDGTEPGYLEAARERGVPLACQWGASPEWNGSKAQLWGPEVYFAEGYCDWSVGYIDAINRYIETGHGGNVYYTPNFMNGQLKLILNPKYENQLGDIYKNAVEDIKSGAVSVPRDLKVFP